MTMKLVDNIWYACRILTNNNTELDVKERIGNKDMNVIYENPVEYVGLNLKNT